MAVQRPEIEIARAESGAELLLTLPAQTPSSPELDRVLAEIPAAYGIAAASPIFQALAHWPDFLIPAWAAWAPLIDSPAYRAALATITVPALPVDRRVPTTEDGLPGYLALQASVLPELLLLATAWYDSASGLGGAGAAVAENPPAREIRAAGLSPAGAAVETDDALSAIALAHGHPRILSPYRVVAADAPFLLAATPSLLDAIASAEYAVARQAILDAAATAAPTVGMPAVPSSDDGPRQILALFRNRMIPPLILDTALFTSMAESTRTMESP